MNIPTAIKRIDILLRKPHPGWQLEDFDAIKLGREALIRIQNIRGIANEGSYTPLPGETED